MSDPRMSKREAIEPFTDNVLQAVRTAGALLVGNSALIFVGIIGPAASRYFDAMVIAVSGLALMFSGSMTFAAARKIKAWRIARTVVESNNKPDGGK